MKASPGREGIAARFAEVPLGGAARPDSLGSLVPFCHVVAGQQQGIGEGGEQGKLPCRGRPPSPAPSRIQGFNTRPSHGSNRPECCLRPVWAQICDVPVPAVPPVPKRTFSQLGSRFSGPVRPSHSRPRRHRTRPRRDMAAQPRAKCRHLVRALVGSRSLRRPGAQGHAARRRGRCRPSWRAHRWGTDAVRVAGVPDTATA
jgi:hypothetical protein